MCSRLRVRRESGSVSVAAEWQAVHAKGEQIGLCCLDFPAVGDIAVGKPFEPDRSPCYVLIAASAAMVVGNVVV